MPLYAQKIIWKNSQETVIIIYEWRLVFLFPLLYFLFCSVINMYRFDQMKSNRLFAKGRIGVICLYNSDIIGIFFQ